MFVLQQPFCHLQLVKRSQLFKLNHLVKLSNEFQAHPDTLELSLRPLPAWFPTHRIALLFQDLSSPLAFYFWRTYGRPSAMHSAACAAARPSDWPSTQVHEQQSVVSVEHANMHAPEPMPRALPASTPSGLKASPRAAGILLVVLASLHSSSKQASMSSTILLTSTAPALIPLAASRLNAARQEGVVSKQTQGSESSAA